MAGTGATRNKPPKWTSGMSLDRKTLNLSRRLSFGLLAVIVCPVVEADTRVQHTAQMDGHKNLHPESKETAHLQAPFVPSFRPSFGNLPGPALQPWHRVACQGCCQRIIRRKRLAVLIDQSPVAAASQPPYLSCPSSPPIRPIHGEPLGDASQNIRGLRLGQPGGIPMPRGHGDGTHQPGRRARLRPPHSAVGWHPRDGPRVLPRSRSTTSCHPSPTEVADHILGVLYDCGSGPEQRLYIQETLNGGDPLEMKSSRRASTAPVSRPAPIGRLQTLCDPFWHRPLTRRGIL